jgi:hypothetical protein
LAVPPPTSWNERVVCSGHPTSLRRAVEIPTFDLKQVAYVERHSKKELSLNPRSIERFNYFGRQIQLWHWICKDPSNEKIKYGDEF